MAEIILSDAETLNTFPFISFIRKLTRACFLPPRNDKYTAQIEPFLVSDIENHEYIMGYVYIRVFPAPK